MADTSRIPTKAGHADWAKLPKGPNGRALCRQCGKETPGKRTTFCGQKCVHEWKLTTQPAYQAACVLERDKGVCEACGRDCLALLEELRRFRQQERVETLPNANWKGLEHNTFPLDQKLTRYQAWCDELRLPKYLRHLYRRLWEMDHRIPVIEGGGGCGLENLRTLCWACHKTATAALAARRAKARRKQQALPLEEVKRG